jgi:hypothetical protein
MINRFTGETFKLFFDNPIGFTYTSDRNNIARRRCGNSEESSDAFVFGEKEDSMIS